MPLQLRSPVLARADAPVQELTPDRLRAALGDFLEPLLGYSLSRSPDREFARDAVQEAVAAALVATGNGRQWEDEDALWMWLIGVVRHKAADEYRRRKRRMPSVSSLGLPASDLLEPVSNGDELPELLAGQVEVQQLCQLALAELPPRHREALEQFYLVGATYREAAEVMGISSKAMESLLARARRELQRVLHRNLSDPEGLL